MKTSLKNSLHILLNFFAIIQFALLLKRREFWLELKRGDRALVLTEMVEFIALPFPFSRKLKICHFTSKLSTDSKNAWCTFRVVVFSLNPLLFWRSPFRCHRSFVRSLLIGRGTLIQRGRLSCFSNFVLFISSIKKILNWNVQYLGCKKKHSFCKISLISLKSSLIPLRKSLWYWNLFYFSSYIQ